MKVSFGPDFAKSLRRLIWRERLKWINPAEYYRNIKWFIQRGRKGYSDADIWNADTHIANTVLAFLDYSDKYGHSYPMGLTEKKWDEHKGELRWLMNEHLEKYNTPYEVIKTDAYQKRYARAQRIFSRYWQTLWD